MGRISREEPCWKLVGLMVAAIALGACGDSGQKPATPPSSPTQDVRVPPPAAAPVAGAADAAPEVEVRKLLDAWLTAQNAGDFDRYATLYAAKFEGVKRSGERVYNFDRSGWLKDRKRMFEKPMTVGADNVRVIATPSFATVTFSQRWASGTYSDVGDKRLVIVKEQNALRIGSETMLASKIAGATVTNAPPPAEFMLVVGSGDALYALLDEMADPTLADGAPILKGGEYHATALKAVRRERLPSSVAAAMDQSFEIYAADGRVCTATLGSTFVMRELVGSGVDLTEDYFGETPAQRAQVVWEMAAASTLLVAQLRVTAGQCEKPVWMRSSALPPPRVFSPGPDDASPGAATLDAFHALPAYRASTRQLRDEGVTLASGEAWEAEGVVRFRQWRSDTRVFETLEAERGGCSEPYASVWSLFEVSTQSAALSVAPMDRFAPSAFQALAVIDFDNDGVVEVIGFAWQSDATLLLRVVNGKLTPVLAAGRTFIGCHC